MIRSGKGMMSMRRFCGVLLSAVILLGANAWGEAQPAPAASAKAGKAKKCTFPKSRRRAPGWVCDKHAEGLAVTALGSAARSRAGFSFMEKMAVADARVHLVQEVRESVQAKLGEDVRTANAEAAERQGATITRITNDALQDTRIAKRTYGPNGTLYVLIGLDQADADKLMEAIATEYRAREGR